MDSTDLRQTALYQQHLYQGAKMVPFHGWHMPLHYGSQVEEHHQVRRACGVFDVSHMRVCDITGEAAATFLNALLSNDVNKLRAVGQAQYTLMLNDAGGILDDLIVYRLADRYRLVLNCGRADEDIAWLRAHSQAFQMEIEPREDLAILALQGPEFLTYCESVFESEVAVAITALKPFTSMMERQTLIARTGYTGEQGVELILPHNKAQDLWQRLMVSGVKPVGLGARDTLRLEAGLNLYGQDMTDQTHPFESNLAWTVALDKPDFVGKTALMAMIDNGVQHQLVGVCLAEKGVLRSGFSVLKQGEPVGELTSGSYSPTLGVSIGLARIESPDSKGVYEVAIRGKRLPVRLLKPGFVRAGLDRTTDYFVDA